LIAVGTELDPSITKSDSLLGQVLGKPDGLPSVVDQAKLSTELFETAVGAPEGDIIEMNLRRPVCAGKGSRIAISRRIGDRWRLIGSGKME
jgi:translation initiation factor 2 subunit 3